MSGYDYASELLSRAQPAAPVQPTPSQPADYAAELFAPRTPEAAKPSFSETLKQRQAELTGSAEFGTQVKAAMVDDPMTKIRIMAKDLFPDEKSPEERFAVHKGEIYYLGKDDKIYKATGSGPFAGAKEFGANIVGNLPSIAGGVAGGVLGSGLASVPLAGLGAAGGKGIQQVIANVAFDEPQTPTGNIKGMGTEAAWAAGGSLVGLGVQKWLARHLAKDISKLNLEDVAEIERKAANVGGTGQKVDLNVAQKTNLPSLKGRVEALSRIPQAADDMNAALETTRTQAGQVADAFVEGVSPTTTSVRSAGEAGRSGAQEIMSRIGKDKAAAASPWYKKAFESRVNLGDENLQRIAETPAFKAAWERGRRIAANEGIDLGDSANNMRALHYVKMGLDDLIERGGTEGIGGTERRAIIGVKYKLLEFMDKASPDYKRARFVYGHFMPTLEAKGAGLVGELADLADTDLVSASRRVFNATNAPQDIVKLRSDFFRYDQGEKWKSLLKGYLQDTLENASKEFKSGAGAGRAATWRYTLMGNPKQVANLRAAMTQEQFKAFNEMMDVFEAVNRTVGRGNSITMQMTEASKNLSAEAKSKLANVLKPRQAIIDWLEEARLGKHATKQVEILTSPEGVKKLRELKKLSPNEQKFIQGFSTLFGVSASPK